MAAELAWVVAAVPEWAAAVAAAAAGNKKWLPLQGAIFYFSLKPAGGVFRKERI